MNKAALAPPTAVAPVVQGDLVRRSRAGDGALRVVLTACGAFVVVATISMIAFLGWAGLRGFQAAGVFSLVFGRVWKPEAHQFGGFALVFGTLSSALGAVVLGALPALLTAVWLTDFAPKGLSQTYRRIMEVVAALPSVVYGWVALVSLVPAVEVFALKLYKADGSIGGEGLATASILLAIMIAPTVLLLSLDALSRVPQALKDASAALGASPWQTAWSVSLPYAWRGLLIAVFFGFARAAGETMAVQMVIGGARRLPSNLFTPTTTISTQIVMDMQNARPFTPESDVLFAMALVLLVLSSTVVLLTRLIGREKARA